MKQNIFHHYSEFYELLNNDKDYENESRYVIKELRKYCKDVKTILEIGMGTGLHASFLSKKGVSVKGIEPSKEMAEIAIKKGIECKVSNSVEFRYEIKFDAVIALFHVISYITDNSSLISTFHNVYNHLKDDGIFMFDIWYTPAVYNLKPHTRLKRVENGKLKINRFAEPFMRYQENIVDVVYEIIAEEKEKGKLNYITETHPMRHFSIPELQLIASFTGFEILNIEEWLTKNEPSEKTWGINLVLRRNAK